MLPLVPVRCSPSDFINPFPPLYVTTAVCSVLLLLQALLLFLTSKVSLVAPQHRWQHWAKPLPLLLLLTAGAALGAVGLTVWVWLQSRSFIPWCAGFAIDLSGQEAAYRAAQDGARVTVIVTACLPLVGLLVVLLTRWQRRAAENSAFPTG
jgi:hypothetical protein